MVVSRSVALALLIAASPTMLRAQVISSLDSSATGARPRTVSVINGGDRRLGVILAGAVVALVPLDAAIGHVARGPALQNNTTIRDAANGLSRVAFPGVNLASYAVYATGVLTANEQTLDAGVHILESVFVASNVTDVLKRVVGRSRPSASSSPLRFDIGNDDASVASASFPSGHSTVAFALAGASAAELAQHYTPGSRFIIPALYATATAVGMARVYGRAHWASDVVAGAAVGMLTGRAIVRMAHAHPGNWLDALAVHGVVAAEGHGRALFGWHAGAP